MEMEKEKRSQTGLASFAILFGGAVWGIYWLPLQMIDEAGVTDFWAIILLMLFSAVAFFGAAFLAGGGLASRIQVTKGAKFVTAGQGSRFVKP